MKFNRRNFLKGSLGVTAVSVVPKGVADQLDKIESSKLTPIYPISNANTLPNETATYSAIPKKAKLRLYSCLYRSFNLNSYNEQTLFNVAVTEDYIWIKRPVVLNVVSETYQSPNCAVTYMSEIIIDARQCSLYKCIDNISLEQAVRLVPKVLFQPLDFVNKSDILDTIKYA